MAKITEEPTGATSSPSLKSLTGAPSFANLLPLQLDAVLPAFKLHNLTGAGIDSLANMWEPNQSSSLPLATQSYRPITKSRIGAAVVYKGHGGIE